MYANQRVLRGIHHVIHGPPCALFLLFVSLSRSCCAQSLSRYLILSVSRLCPLRFRNSSNFSGIPLSFPLNRIPLF
jgi:hypothetical protein